jgi:hypothetical protein
VIIALALGELLAKNAAAREALDSGRPTRIPGETGPTALASKVLSARGGVGLLTSVDAAAVGGMMRGDMDLA